MQPVRIACLVSWTVLQFEKKHSLFIVEIMDEKTYRSIVQATQADTAEKIALESLVAIESHMALERNTFDRSCSWGVK